MMSRSRNRLRKKSPTSGKVLGPPMFNIKIPVFGGFSVDLDSVVDNLVMFNHWADVIAGKNCLGIEIARLSGTAIIALED